jgi:hypothetical protein
MQSSSGEWFLGVHGGCQYSLDSLRLVAAGVRRPRGRGHNVDTPGARCSVATKFHPVRDRGS